MNHENYLYCDGDGEPIPGLVCIVSHPCARELDAKGVRTIHVPARLAPLCRDRPPSRRHESQVCLPWAIHRRPPEAPVQSLEFTEASQLSGVLQPPPPTFPKDGSPGLWSQGRSRTQNRACGLTMGLHAEGNAGHEASRAAVCRQAGRRWRAWACRGTLVARVRTAAEEPSARRGGASSYRPPVRTLTYFMPEIFKLFLSNGPIGYRKIRVTMELNHATVSITHPRFHKKERRASRMSPASKPSGGHTARK